MAKKYKFILTLPYEIKVDSAERIDGHMSWPNYSHAEPRVYKGIFDSYNEAKEYASKFKIYKYVLNFTDYDSFESNDENFFFISIFDAEDAVCALLGIVPGDPYCDYAENYTIEETEYEGHKVYKYSLHYSNQCVYDSLEDDEYFMTYDKAEETARYVKENYQIELGGLDEYYSFVPIEILDISIEEI